MRSERRCAATAACSRGRCCATLRRGSNPWRRRRAAPDRFAVQSGAAYAAMPYSTVTLLARLRGWSTSSPLRRAIS